MPPMISLDKNVDLSEYVLLIPSVSVGNVPQLTIDLLISTYSFKKISTIWHPAIVSSVGGDPYQSDRSEICTACELHINEQLKVAAIQIRSTLEFKLAQKFFIDLKEALSPLKLKNIVIVSSAFDYELRNFNNEKFYYSSNEKIDEIMETNGIKILEPNSNGRYCINGAGFATKLYEVLSTQFRCTLLVKYVSEGDNRPDAFTTLKKLFAISGLEEKTLNVIFPSSWDFVFGGPPPVGIY
ncbi:hypothetical protein NQ318_010094 [Aromia moschata]|uniref:Proteasome assembly chaperone 2 n=1 Tax=Aromia moschata TaxID=1265417 RepID=A0AAV8Y9V7_9CUCU|nr:hypothetical protein NQ318_010094 [Aromia moschata]